MQCSTVLGDPVNKGNISQICFLFVQIFCTCLMPPVVWHIFNIVSQIVNAVKVQHHRLHFVLIIREPIHGTVLL